MIHIPRLLSVVLPTAVFITVCPQVYGYGQSLTVGPNSIMDLLWTKPDGTAQYWRLNATGVPTSKVNYPPL